MQFKWNRDCREFKGDYACDVLRSENYKSCEDCKFYDPISKKILILKFGAIGDVVRTTSLLPSIKKKYSGSKIIWLIEKKYKDLIKNNKYVDKILEYNNENILRLDYEEFDVLINLEKDPPANIIARKVKAKEKFGFYFDDDGYPSAFNKKAEVYLENSLSNFINKSNRKTYQEMMAEVAELDYNKEEYIIYLSEKDKEYAREFMKKNNINKDDKIIGISFGSSWRWPSKRWSKDRVIELIKKLNNETDYKIMLLGGPEEKGFIDDILKSIRGINVLINDFDNSLTEFNSIVNLCESVVTGDTLHLHVAIGLKKKVVALFFCTPPWEIEGYNRIKKLVSPLLGKYFFTDEYDGELVNSISSEEVFNALMEFKKGD